MVAVIERRSRRAGDPLVGGVSVVVACHSEERLPLLEGCVRSALGQEVLTPSEVVVAVDNNEALYRRLLSAYALQPRVKVVLNTARRGASATRNCGVAAAEGVLVAFLDDDVVADPAWLRRLIAPLADPAVAGTGGSAVPRWQTSQPRWFPEEFMWVVGASFKGMPTETAEVRNVWSENMAIRRKQFLSCGGFREGFGKLRDASAPEDTEMCIRFARRTGDHWVYVPDARVEHFVPSARATFRFFLRRSASEGSGKVQMRRLTHERLTSERSYAVRTLPAAVRRYASSALRGDGVAFLCLFAVIAGSLAAALGAMYSCVRLAALPGPADESVRVPSLGG